MALTLFLRSLQRHPLASLLNLVTLALGIAVFILLGLYARFETSFENWTPEANHIWVVQEQFSQPGSPADPAEKPYSMGALLEIMQADFPGLKGFRVRGGEKDMAIPVTISGHVEPVGFVMVDPEFARIAAPLVRAGDLRATLSRPGNVAITQSLSRRLFGEVSPIGRTIVLTPDVTPRPYRITALLADPPANSEWQYRVLLRLGPEQFDKGYDENWAHWGSRRLMTYLIFPDVVAAQAFEVRLPDFVHRHAEHDLGPNPEKIFRYRLIPLTDVHLLKPSERYIVAAIGLIGLLTLLMAIANYINLQTARAGLRAREVAMRKVMGTPRATLVRDYWLETLILTFVAAWIGIALVELALPSINARLGLDLVLRYSGSDGVLLWLMPLVIVIALLAGLYPAIMLSGAPIAPALSASRGPGGGRAGTRLRTLLVVFQFSLAVAFMIGAAVIFNQLSYLRSQDPGFDRDALISVNSFDAPELSENERNALLTTMTRIPNIAHISYASDGPARDSQNSNDFERSDISTKKVTLQYITVGPGWLQTMGVRLIAGRFFDPRFRLDDSVQRVDGDIGNILINRSAVRKLGYTSPQAAIGQHIKDGRERQIVGVIDDVSFFSPHEEVPAMALFYSSKPRPGDEALIRVRSGENSMVMNRLAQTWRQIAPNVPFDAKFADVAMQDYYERDDRTALLIIWGCALALVISCIGLLGLATFTTQRRLREIGIRKTLGASAGQVTALLVGQFLKPVGVAIVIGAPLGWVAISRWLAIFPDQVGFNPLWLIGPALIALLGAALTVALQSARAAFTPPARSLRGD